MASIGHNISFLFDRTIKKDTLHERIPKDKQSGNSMKET